MISWALYQCAICGRERTWVAGKSITCVHSRRIRGAGPSVMLELGASEREDVSGVAKEPGR